MEKHDIFNQKQLQKYKFFFTFAVQFKAEFRVKWLNTLLWGGSAGNTACWFESSLGHFEAFLTFKERLFYFPLLTYISFNFEPMYNTIKQPTELKYR